MEKQEIVSIIVPVYKVEKYIKRCLDSLINQTYKEIEIILIDDGSPDESGKICDTYAERDSRIKVIHKINEGVSIARNVGISKATGKYLMFVDSDDWLENNAVEVLYQKISSENLDMVRANYFINTDTEEKIAPINELLKFDNVILSDSQYFKEEIVRSFLDGGIPGYLWLFIIKKELINNDKPFKEDISLAEDLIFLMEIFARTENIYFLNIPLYVFSFEADIQELLLQLYLHHLL